MTSTERNRHKRSFAQREQSAAPFHSASQVQVGVGGDAFYGTVVVRIPPAMPPAARGAHRAGMRMAAGDVPEDAHPEARSALLDRKRTGIVRLPLSHPRILRHGPRSPGKKTSVSWDPKWRWINADS